MPTLGEVRVRVTLVPAAPPPGIRAGFLVRLERYEAHGFLNLERRWALVQQRVATTRDSIPQVSADLLADWEATGVVATADNKRGTDG